MTSESPLDKFVQAVVYDYMTATGLKKCTNHVEIVEFASSIDYCFTMSEWQDYFRNDFAELTPAQQESIRSYDPQHWSWAFRQISSWRAMLMDGA